MRILIDPNTRKPIIYGGKAFKVSTTKSGILVNSNNVPIALNGNLIMAEKFVVKSYLEKFYINESAESLTFEVIE